MLFLIQFPTLLKQASKKIQVFCKNTYYALAFLQLWVIVFFICFGFYFLFFPQKVIN